MERRRTKVPSARLEIVRRVQRQQGSLTARQTCRAGAKAGLSDPAVASGSAVAQRIKGTPGITGLSVPRVHIDEPVWHLDVRSSPTVAEEGGDDGGRLEGGQEVLQFLRMSDRAGRGCPPPCGPPRGRGAAPPSPG